MAEQATMVVSPACSTRPLCAPALEATALTFTRARQVVFRDLDLSVAPGEMVALLGANGAGKTTLLHCLAGVLHPTAGEVRWFGTAVARTWTARRLVGFVGHERGLYLALTAWENLLFAGRMAGVDQPADRAAALLAAVGLKHHAQQRAGALSRGMQQRLAIARAVLHEPPILLLDEPFTSLDSDSRGWLTEFLGSLQGNGRAILFATHDLEHSARLADRFVSLAAGRLRGSQNGRP